MTCTEIANAHGFFYAHDCQVCKSRYGVFLNPEFPSVEVKIKKNKDYVKIFKGGKQVAVSNNANFEQTLKTLGLVKENVTA